MRDLGITIPGFLDTLIMHRAVAHVVLQSTKFSTTIPVGISRFRTSHSEVLGIDQPGDAYSRHGS
jgi:hypothetical protein